MKRLNTRFLAEALLEVFDSAFFQAGAVLASTQGCGVVAQSPFTWDRLLKPYQRASQFFKEVAPAASDVHRQTAADKSTARPVANAEKVIKLLDPLPNACVSAVTGRV